jgi:hypothetical protein
LQRLGELAVFETVGADDQGSHVPSRYRMSSSR